MPPLGSAVLTFFWVAVPAMLLMGVWAGVTAYRLLFPDEPLPMDPAARRRRLTRQGQYVPVRLHDILEDERARHAAGPRGTPPAPAPPSASARPPVAGPSSATHPLFADLWIRRN